MANDVRQARRLRLSYCAVFKGSCGNRAMGRSFSQASTSAPLTRRRAFWAASYRRLGAAIRDNRLTLTAISRDDGHHYSCSHAESLNAFERFGNRSNESDH